MDLSLWWETLTVLQKIYWVIAVTSTIIFLIQLVMLFIGGDADDTDFDHGVDSHDLHGDGIDLFSLKSIIAFLMFFGWSGLAAIQAGMIVWWASLGISFVTGFIMMLLTAWIIMMLFRLQQTGTMDFDTAVGKSAEVYIPIPPKMTGQGQVQIILNGSYKTLDAVTNDNEEIKSRSIVEVFDVQGETLVVSKIK